MRSLFLKGRRAAALDPRARAQAVRALAFLLGARAALAILPYGTLRRLVERVRPRAAHRPSMTPGECSRAVARAGQILPASRCLALGLAAEYLLRREGREASLVLGARLDGEGRLHAHAWVQSEGITVTGAVEAPHYIPLAPRTVR